MKSYESRMKMERNCYLKRVFSTGVSTTFAPDCEYSKLQITVSNYTMSN